MKYFVAQMTCNVGRSQDVMIYAGEALRWVLENIPKGMYVATGPYINEAGEFDDALWIARAESRESLEEFLKTDPFYTMGVRAFPTVRQWDYHVDELGYRIDFPPHLAEQWGITPEVTKMRLKSLKPKSDGSTKYFVVQMTCNAGRAQDVMIHAGEHIRWVLENIPKEMYVVAGPFTNLKGDFDDGLAIMKAESKEALEETMTTDPFYTMGIRNFMIRQWDYYIDEFGFRTDIPPHLAERWGITPEMTKGRFQPSKV